LQGTQTELGVKGQTHRKVGPSAVCQAERPVKVAGLSLADGRSERSGLSAGTG